jgi:hypothetical protein
MVMAAKIGKPICHPDLLDGLSLAKHGVIIVPWPAAIHLNSLKIEGRGIIQPFSELIYLVTS